MPRCPFCNKILSDAWVKHEGAALMGKASGRSKARSHAQAKAASKVRWLGHFDQPSPDSQTKKKRRT